MQVIYVSVFFGELMRGFMIQFFIFLSWLGKYLFIGKYDCIVQDLVLYMSFRIYFSKRIVNMDYLLYLRDVFVQFLIL